MRWLVRSELCVCVCVCAKLIRIAGESGVQDMHFLSGTEDFGPQIYCSWQSIKAYELPSKLYGQKIAQCLKVQASLFGKGVCLETRVHDILLLDWVKT